MSETTRLNSRSRDIACIGSARTATGVIGERVLRSANESAVPARHDQAGRFDPRCERSRLEGSRLTVSVCGGRPVSAPRPQSSTGAGTSTATVIEVHRDLTELRCGNLAWLRSSAVRSPWDPRANRSCRMIREEAEHRSIARDPAGSFVEHAGESNCGQDPTSPRLPLGRILGSKRMRFPRRETTGKAEGVG